MAVRGGTPKAPKPVAGRTRASRAVSGKPKVTVPDSVEAVTRGELTRIGALASVEGQVAINLAKVLDDRAGIQGGGVASTAKQLREVMQAVRESRRPVGRSGLALIRDAAV